MFPTLKEAERAYLDTLKTLEGEVVRARYGMQIERRGSTIVFQHGKLLDDYARRPLPAKVSTRWTAAELVFVNQAADAKLAGKALTDCITTVRHRLDLLCTPLRSRAAIRARIQRRIDEVLDASTDRAVADITRRAREGDARADGEY